MISRRRATPARPDRRRYENFRELCLVLRFEWRERKRWKNRRARLRGMYWALVRRYAYEICQDCGRPVGHSLGDTWWHTADELWLVVMDSPNGVVCIACFTERARAKGIGVSWVPEVYSEYLRGWGA